MTDDNKQMDTDLADSITMLEQILEVMPGDTMAVKALYNAYCQCDRRDRAFEYLGKLSDIVYDSGEVETAAVNVPRTAEVVRSSALSKYAMTKPAASTR